MSSHSSSAMRLARLWFHREEPEARMPRHVLYLARKLAAGSDTSPGLLSFSWVLLESMYTNLGWDIPSEPALAHCLSAAQSCAHACRLAADELLAELPLSNGPVAVLNSLTFSETLFGRWDMIPPVDTLIIPLDDAQSEPMSATSLRAGRGTWHAGPGRLHDELASGSPSAAFPGALLPTPAVILTMTARPALAGDDTAALFFCAALHACSKLDAWDHAWRIATRAGTHNHLIMAARKHHAHLPVSKRPSLTFRLRLLLTNLNKNTAGLR